MDTKLADIIKSLQSSESKLAKPLKAIFEAVARNNGQILVEDGLEGVFSRPEGRIKLEHGSVRISEIIVTEDSIYFVWTGHSTESHSYPNENEIVGMYKHVIVPIVGYTLQKTYLILQVQLDGDLKAHFRAISTDQNNKVSLFAFDPKEPTMFIQGVVEYLSNPIIRVNNTMFGLKEVEDLGF